MTRKDLIKQIYYKNKVNFIFLFLSSIMEAGALIVVSLLLEKILNVAYTKDLNELYKQGIIIVVLLALIVICYSFLLHIKPKYKKKAITQYKNNIYNNVLSKSIQAFSQHDTSEYISAFTNDVNYIEEHYIFSIFSLLTQIVLFVTTLVIMFIYNPILSAAAIGLALLPLIVSLLVGGKLALHEKNISDENASFMHFIKDNFIGFSTIKVFKSEYKIKELFKRNNDKLEEIKSKKIRTTVLMDFLQTFTSLLAQFGVFFLGAYLSITTDKMAPSVIILFVQLMNYVMSPLIQVPSIISTRNACLPLFDKMANMIQSEEESGKKEITFNECIKLQNVSFAYDEKQVLNNISYTFEKNKSYAIVGTSGSGKSTLINLLMGRYLNYEGNINYDKQELRELSIDSLYNISSSVEQNVFVFDDTIINNITMYSNFDEQIINQVLAESGLTELVNQKGEDYKCGENGTALSGGEKQRISIARALLKKSQIILMDEATSALDNETSSRIINNVLDIKNTTKIIITHRLDENTLSKYDQILVIKNGQLIENGTFNELINKNGLFKNLYDIN